MKTVMKIVKWVCIVIVFVFLQTCVKALVKATANSRMTKEVTASVDVGSYEKRVAQKQGTTQDIEKKLEMLARTMNEDLPQKVNDDAIFEKVEKREGREIRYYYTYLVDENFELTKEEKDAHRRGMINQAKYSDDFRLFRKYGVTMSYVYKRQNGEQFMFIKIIPEDYQ